MANAMIQYIQYYNTNGKEIKRKYPKPVSITKARIDAIQLLRAGKVGDPPISFSMTCVALTKDNDSWHDGVEPIEQITLQRAVVGNSRVFYCARAWNVGLKKWIWLTDNGRTKSNVQAW